MSPRVIKAHRIHFQRVPEDTYSLDLDNEMQGIPCDSSGTPSLSGVLASAIATVYKGAREDTGWTFSRTDTGCTSTVHSTSGLVQVTAISADKASVRVTATKDGMSRSAVLSLYKVKAAQPSEAPTVYSIEVSADTISCDKNGTLTPASLSAYKVISIGDWREYTLWCTLKYLREGIDAAEQTLSGTGGQIPGITPECRAITLTLYDYDGAVLDRERVPVIRDGADGLPGPPGEDAFLLDLDNEMQGIPCLADGTPTISGILASATATVYRGASVDSGWTFSTIDTDCESTVHPTSGLVQVISISDTADRASVRVTATKDGMSRSAVLSLYKVRAGEGSSGSGGSPTVYSIEVSDSSISRSAAGILTPSSITARKVRTTAESRAYTSDKKLTCRRVGQDAEPFELTGTGGEITGITSACSAVQLRLLDSDGTTLLDAERIPVVRDGLPGDDAVRCWLVPSVTQVSRSESGIHTPASVSCKAMRKTGAASDQETTDMFITLSSVDYSGNITATVAYTPGSPVTVTQAMRQMIFRLYSIGLGNQGIGSVLDTATVTVVSDGMSASGGESTQGPPGPPVPPPMLWDDYPASYEFQDGKKAVGGAAASRLDCVLMHNTATDTKDRYPLVIYRCIKSHLKAADKMPGNTTYWERSSDFTTIATQVILALNGFIKILSSQALRIYDTDGQTVSAALSGGAWPAWFGATLPADAPTKISSDGTFYSRKAVIEGDVIFGGRVKPMLTVITSDNYTQYRTESYPGEWHLDFSTLSGLVILHSSLSSIPEEQLIRSVMVACRYVKENGSSSVWGSPEEYIGSRMRIVNTTSVTYGITGLLTDDRDSLASGKSYSIQPSSEIDIECVVRPVYDRMAVGWYVEYRGPTVYTT